MSDQPTLEGVQSLVSAFHKQRREEGALWKEISEDETALAVARHFVLIEKQRHIDEIRALDSDKHTLECALQSERERAEKAERERDEAEEAIRHLCALEVTQPVTGEAVPCRECGMTKAPVGRSIPLSGSYCDRDCTGYRKEPFPMSLWPGETLADFGYPKERAEADWLLRGALARPAVRRALERKAKP